MSQARIDKLNAIGRDCGYMVEFVPTTYRGMWPQKSAKPWHIKGLDNRLVASFATIDKLETNLRGRCGC